MDPKFLRIYLGKSANVSCLSDSEVTWTHNKNEPKSNFIREMFGQVYLYQVRLNNIGLYVCFGNFKLREHLIPFYAELHVIIIGMSIS